MIHIAKLVVALGLSLLLMAFQARAQSDVKSLSLQYYSTLKSQDVNSLALVVSGMEDAYGTANAIAVAEHRVPLYCQPDELALNAANILRILDNETKLTKRAPNTPLSFILLDGLRRTFPCKK
jgi:hypothetical protein